MLGRLLQLISDLHHCGSYDFSSFGGETIDTLRMMNSQINFQVNLLILIRIMKVVVTKLRLQSSFSTQQLQIHKAVRATLILFPLLGITNLLFFINPKSLQKREHEFLYMLVNSVLKSSQVEQE